MHVELALDARCHGGQDDTGLALETLCAAIDEGFDTVWIVFAFFGDGDKHGIDPSPCFDGVEAADDELELLVEGLVKVLDSVVVWRNADTLDASLDKVGCYFSLVFAHV
jgi:hypothetical protein